MRDSITAAALKELRMIQQQHQQGVLLLFPLSLALSRHSLANPSSVHCDCINLFLSHGRSQRGLIFPRTSSLALLLAPSLPLTVSVRKYWLGYRFENNLREKKTFSDATPLHSSVSGIITLHHCSSSFGIWKSERRKWRNMRRESGGREVRKWWRKSSEEVESVKIFIILSFSVWWLATTTCCHHHQWIHLCLHLLLLNLNTLWPFLLSWSIHIKIDLFVR